MSIIIKWWKGHGTKILGSTAALLATAQSALAAMTASPQFQLLVTPRQFAYLSIINVVLGVIVIRRGFTNSRNQQ